MWRRLTLSLAILAAPAPAAGQELELAELERQALIASPALLEAAARRDAARARAEGAGLAADPRLELWARNLAPAAAGVERELDVEVMQPVRFPGKREAIRALAASELELAETELEAERRRVLVEIRRTFARLSAADREQRSLAEAHDLLELVTETARVRYGSGQEGALAVLESELMTDRHDLELERVFAGFLADRARLAALVGAEPQTLPLLVGQMPAAEFPAVERALPVDAEAPRLAAARRRVDLAEQGLALVRLDLRPDFMLGGGLAWSESGDPRLTARAGVDLPFFRRRRVEPAIRAAEAELVAARAAAAAVELEARADATRWAAELDRFDRALARLSGAVIPRTSAALELARLAFLEGDLPFSRLLDLQIEWFEARVDLARVESERFALWAEWQELAPSSPDLTDLPGESP